MVARSENHTYLMRGLLLRINMAIDNESRKSTDIVASRYVYDWMASGTTWAHGLHS